MPRFQVGSFQLINTKKWVPAGVILKNDDGQEVIQEVEFPLEYRFETKEEADRFFRSHYIQEGFSEIEGK